MATKVQKKVKTTNVLSVYFLLTYVFLSSLNFVVLLQAKLCELQYGLIRCKRLVCGAERYIRVRKRYV